jgi:UDP-N-acetylmuramate: L-alanyl-gamma-D-glutamyl-meso-diaminopimelate ligase
LQLHFPAKKLNVIFEPHTFSWRNHDAKAWYADVFNGVDNVAIYQPPIHGATSHNQMTHEEILKAARENHSAIAAFTNREELHAWMNDSVNANSVLLILTSGAFDGMIPDMIQWCDDHFPIS